MTYDKNSCALTGVELLTLVISHLIGENYLELKVVFSYKMTSMANCKQATCSLARVVIK
jgi:hypothetical protein